MSSIMGYISIAIICQAITIYSIYMKRDEHKVSTYIVFYFFCTSITWIGEFVVLGLFNAYEYRTGVFEDIWAQNLLGHLLLNVSMFPAASITMVAFSLRYRYFASTAGLFILAEYVFVKLGFYEQHWWRYYMSVINLGIFMLLSRKWFSKMNHERCGLTRTVVFYFVSFLFLHLPSPILLLFNKQHYQFSWINHLVHNSYRTSIMVSFIYDLLFNAVCVFFVCVLGRWYWKAVPFVISVVGIIILAKTNILVIHEGWNLLYSLFIQQIMLILFVLFEKHTLKPMKSCTESND